MIFLSPAISVSLESFIPRNPRIMLSSKTLMLATIIFAAHHLSYSQNKVSDSIYYRNEISVNISPIAAVFTSGQVAESAFSIGHAHNFGKNHFLRTGIKFIPSIARSRDITLEGFLSSYQFTQWKPDRKSVV